MPKHKGGRDVGHTRNRWARKKRGEMGLSGYTCLFCSKKLRKYIDRERHEADEHRWEVVMAQIKDVDNEILEELRFLGSLTPAAQRFEKNGVPSPRSFEVHRKAVLEGMQTKRVRLSQKLDKHIFVEIERPKRDALRAKMGEAPDFYDMRGQIVKSD